MQFDLPLEGKVDTVKYWLRDIRIPRLHHLSVEIVHQIHSRNTLFWLFENRCNRCLDSVRKDDGLCLRKAAIPVTKREPEAFVRVQNVESNIVL